MSCIIARKSRASIRGNYVIAKLTCGISVIAENKLHSHHETLFHTMKVVTILIPSFQGLRKERVSYKLGPRRKKKTETPVFLESHSAKASSTKNWRLRSAFDSCWRVKCIFNGFEFFKMHCNVSQWFVTYFLTFPMNACWTSSNDEEWSTLWQCYHLSFCEMIKKDSERSTRDT